MKRLMSSGPKHHNPKRQNGAAVTIRVTVAKVLSLSRQHLRPRAIVAQLHPRRASANQGQLTDRVRHLLWAEAQKADGLFMAYDDGYALRAKEERRLRALVRHALHTNGFALRGNGHITQRLDTKESVRKLHLGARSEKLVTSKAFLLKNEATLLEHFADGEQVDVARIQPRLQLVLSDSPNNWLFRYATLLWSVPVSMGFGRRLRFLVWDDQNDKLIGLFAIGDPVFNLTCRDQWIDWDHKARAARLYNVMDIFTLGAVPPYSMLLGGKLVAMIAASNEVREIVRQRYSGNRTLIENKTKDPTLALLTTSSALGRSALYHRIRFNKRQLYHRIGVSKGWGHFHLNNVLFRDLRRYLHATVGDDEGGNRFGDGPNWKIRTARSALQHLRMPGELLRHGVNREIYGVPLAVNFRSFLRGETDFLELEDTPFDDLVDFWKTRWLHDRAIRRPEFRGFHHQEVPALIRAIGG